MEIDTQTLAEQPWEETLDVLTADMNPQDIDICLLTSRYREYIDELEQFDLEVPAKAVRISTALLRMKTLALAGEYAEEEEQEPENPMDFEEEQMIEEDMVEDEGPGLDVGPDLEVPVKAKPRRRMSLNELKDSLRDAMEVKEKRRERQQQREQMDDPVDINEESLEEKIDSVFTRLSSLIGGGKEKISFDRLMEENDNEERIEKFLHVLHLENDRKVRCIQEEWLGELKVRPQKDSEQIVN